MIDTSRVQTGFDVEMQLGGGWFATALQGLVDTGAVAAPPPAAPGTPIVVTAVQVLATDPVNDLQIDLLVGALPIQTQAQLSLNAAGNQLTITTNANLAFTIPFGVLSGLAGPPELTKAAGDGSSDPAIVLLANLDLRASGQDGDPLPAGQHLDRGDASLVRSFLPAGSHIAFGIGSGTFPRLANDIWHTQLTEPDGTHPLPDASDPKGTWHAAEMTAQAGRIRLRLVGEVPIDLWPDADVEIQIDITPRLVEGRLAFDFDIDSDVDTGVLGDLFAFLIGGLIGLVIGALLGGLVGAAIGGGVGGVLGVVALEVGEAIVEGVVTRRIEARLEDERIAVLACSDHVIVSALPEAEEGGLALRVLDAIPRSIPIFEDAPDPLHARHVLVTSDYDDFTIDANGFAAAGSARVQERFQPVPVSLVDRIRTPDDTGELSELVYEVGGVQVQVPLAEALARVGDGDLLDHRIRISELPDDATTTLLDGTLASVCLAPDAIRRAETVVTEIRFTTGLDLRVPEAILLQESGVIVLPRLQLIRPSNASPYFRSPPNETTDDNFESLPLF